MDCKELLNTVVYKDLCTHCGTCVGVCPDDVLYFEDNLIQAHEDKCTKCGKCVFSCPGKYFDFKEYNQKVFQTDYEIIDKDIGYYSKIFKAYSSDDGIRKNASSGGIITCLLIHLLEEKIVDKVIVVDKVNDVLDFKKLLTNNIAQVKSASQSKYMVIAGNEILQKIKKDDGRIAFVGLPCEIQGLRKVKAKYRNLIPDDMIFISLFCGFNMFDQGTLALLKKLKIQKSILSNVNYRRKQGNATGFEATTRDGKTKFIDKHSYNYLNMFFSPQRCLKCYDFTGEFADISVGDAWEEEGSWSRVIIRNDELNEIFNSMKNKKRIVVKDSSKEDILVTQKQLIDYKKKWFFVRKKLSRNFPENNIEEPEMSAKDIFKGIVFHIFLMVGHMRIGRLFIQMAPIRLLSKISRFSRRKLNDS